MRSGIKNYVKSFQCILIAFIWVKILTAIDYRKMIMQVRSAILDIEVNNIQSHIKDLKQLREQWDAILDESKLLTENIGIEPVLPERRQRKRKRFADESVQDDKYYLYSGEHDSWSNKSFSLIFTLELCISVALHLYYNLIAHICAFTIWLYILEKGIHTKKRHFWV